MIYETELIGEKLSNIDKAIKFRKLYSDLNSNKENKFLHSFFHDNNRLNLQFDGFLLIYHNLNYENRDFPKINYFTDFIRLNATFSLILKIIINQLNIIKIGGDAFNIVDNPLYHDQKLNKPLESYEIRNLLDKLINEDSEQIFDKIVYLKNNFSSSNLFKSYIEALRIGNKNLEEYELNIQSSFYLLAQIIYQYVKDGQINLINDEDIINFKHNSTVEGKFFDIKFLPSNSNFLINTNDIIKIEYEKKSYKGFVTLFTYKFNQKKGHIIRIKGEILNDEGLNLKSKYNLIIDNHLKKYL